MTLLRFVFVHALVTSAAGAALAQAALAPPNPQQARCIEAFAETQEEKAIRAKMGEPPADIDSIEEAYAWGVKRSIAVFGSVRAAEDFGEKAQRAKYTRRLELLRKNAQEGHLPSLYLLVTWPLRLEETEGIRGLPTAEERSAAFRTLYDHGFPFAPRWMAAECNQALDRSSEEKPPAAIGCTTATCRIQRSGTEIEILDSPEAAEAYDRAREAREAEEARRLAEIATNRVACVDLLREGGFRGDAVAWEELAQYDDSTGANPVGIVPPVEHYAWLELEELALREISEYLAGEDSVPRSHQQDLVKDFLNDEQRRDAQALAAKYAEILWPRRILSGQPDERDCRLVPQFAADPAPYGPDPSPR